MCYCVFSVSHGLNSPNDFSLVFLRRMYQYHVNMHCSLQFGLSCQVRACSKSTPGGDTGTDLQELQYFKVSVFFSVFNSIFKLLWLMSCFSPFRKREGAVSAQSINRDLIEAMTNKLGLQINSFSHLLQTREFLQEVCKRQNFSKTCIFISIDGTLLRPTPLCCLLYNSP